MKLNSPLSIVTYVSMSLGRPLFTDNEFTSYMMPRFSYIPFDKFVPMIEKAVIKTVENSELKLARYKKRDIARILIMSEYNDFVSAVETTSSSPQNHDEIGEVIDDKIKKFTKQLMNSNLKMVTEINLSGFDIHLINLSMLQMFPRLSTLVMIKTGITSEQIGMLGKLKRLDMLLLGYNEITKFPNLNDGFNGVKRILISLIWNDIQDFDVEIKRNKAIHIALDSVPDKECYEKLTNAFGGVKLLSELSETTKKTTTLATPKADKKRKRWFRYFWGKIQNHVAS